MTSPFRASARARAAAVLPQPVGPARQMTGRGAAILFVDAEAAVGSGQAGSGLAHFAALVFFHQAQAHVLGHQAHDVGAVAGRGLDDGGADEQPLLRC